jgi:prophage regulatory protein
MDKLLTEKQVTEIVGFKKTKLYQMIKEGTFPAAKKYGKVNKWFQSDIEEWLKKEKKELHNDDGIFTEIGKFFDDLLS